MKRKFSNKHLSYILCTMLIVAMAFFTVGCNDKNNAVPQTETAETVDTFEEKSDLQVLGEGETKFLFTVVDSEGVETCFEIHTDKPMVGEALLELGLIEGEEGAYGLYVKTVNGETADYDADGKYWAFYVNDEYAQAGVDMTEIKEGETYSFKVEKA